MYYLIKDDSSRVELTVIADLPGTDYINASYINVRTHTHTHIHNVKSHCSYLQGYRRPKAYIAAQG